MTETGTSVTFWQPSMSDQVTVKITGLDKLQKALEQLPERAAKKIEGGSLKEAAQITLAEMRARVPKDTGLLSEHFGVRVVTKRMGKGNLSARAFIGGITGVEYPPPETFRKKLKDKAIHWKIYVNTALHFLEFGSVHERKRPFMSISWEATKDSVLAKFIDALKEALGL